MSTRLVRTNRAGYEIRRAEIPVELWSARSACRRQNRLSMDEVVVLCCSGQPRTKSPDKIVPFGIDRGALCRMRNMDKSGHRRGYGHKCGGRCRTAHDPFVRASETRLESCDSGGRP